MAHGLATLELGAIVLTPYLGGVRFMRRAAIRVPVGQIDRSEQRSVSGREALSAMPGTQVICVRTGAATLEWVLMPDQAEWAATLVTPA
ncbi:MAG: hypothetical protein QOE97_2736 [Pseudonocardiales bacterium]|jgi:hypothetical protein|nr:hypothetical protein [Pseudonocardiales bacterium]